MLADGSGVAFSAACWTAAPRQDLPACGAPQGAMRGVQVLHGALLLLPRRRRVHCAEEHALVHRGSSSHGGLACGAYFGCAVVRARDVRRRHPRRAREVPRHLGGDRARDLARAAAVRRARAAGRGGGDRPPRAGGRHHQGAAGQEAARLRGGDGRRRSALERENGVREHWTRRRAGGARAWAAAGAGACGEACFAPVRIRPNHPPTWLEPEQVEHEAVPNKRVWYDERAARGIQSNIRKRSL